MINAYGQDATIARFESVYDTTAHKNIDSSVGNWNLKILVENFNSFEISNSNGVITSNDRKGFIADYTPAINDLVVIGGQEYTIKNLETDVAGIHLVQLRRRT